MRRVLPPLGPTRQAGVIAELLRIYFLFLNALLCLFAQAKLQNLCPLLAYLAAPRGIEPPLEH